MTVRVFTECKFDLKYYVNTVKKDNLVCMCFQKYIMFATKHSKMNQLQKIFESKANEHKTKYLNWSVKVESCKMCGKITK